MDIDKIVLNRRPMPYDWRDYRMLSYITPEMRARAARTTWVDWPVDHILNQGSSPHCVGFAWAGFGISYPVEQLTWNNETGHAIYAQAKIEDGHPEYDGSDTRSGVKAFMHFGNLKDNVYAFANSIDDIITWVATIGPVVTGTNWYTSMFHPDSSGWVWIAGEIAGGHEWMINGVNTIEKYFRCTNSWGDGWGQRGQFLISFATYERLMAEQGDAVVTTEVPGEVPPVKPGCDPRAQLANWLIKSMKQKI